MRITSIENQKRNQSRRSVFIDGKYALSLSANLVDVLKLNANDSISKNNFEKISVASELEKAFSRALKFRSIRHRTATEIKNYLLKKKYSDLTIEKTIVKLQKLNFIDDKEYARMFCADRLHLKPISQKALVLLLQKKGVNRLIAEDAAQSAYINVDEDKIIYELASKKFNQMTSSLKSINPEKQKKRLINYLLSRGFSTEKIFQTIKNFYK